MAISLDFLMTIVIIHQMYYQMLLKARDDVLEFLPDLLENKEKYQELYNELTKLEIVD